MNANVYAHALALALTPLPHAHTRGTWEQRAARATAVATRRSIPAAHTHQPTNPPTHPPTHCTPRVRRRDRRASCDNTRASKSKM